MGVAEVLGAMAIIDNIINSDISIYNLPQMPRVVTEDYGLPVFGNYKQTQLDDNPSDLVPRAIPQMLEPFVGRVQTVIDPLLGEYDVLHPNGSIVRVIHANGAGVILNVNDPITVISDSTGNQYLTNEKPATKIKFVSAGKQISTSVDGNGLWQFELVNYTSTAPILDGTVDVVDCNHILSSSTSGFIASLIPQGVSPSGNQLFALADLPASTTGSMNSILISYLNDANPIPTSPGSTFTQAVPSILVDRTTGIDAIFTSGQVELRMVEAGITYTGVITPGAQVLGGPKTVTSTFTDQFASVFGGGVATLAINTVSPFVPNTDALIVTAKGFVNDGTPLTPLSVGYDLASNAFVFEASDGITGATVDVNLVVVDSTNTRKTGQWIPVHPVTGDQYSAGLLTNLVGNLKIPTGTTTAPVTLGFLFYNPVTNVFTVGDGSTAQPAPTTNAPGTVTVYDWDHVHRTQTVAAGTWVQLYRTNIKANTVKKVGDCFSLDAAGFFDSPDGGSVEWRLYFGATNTTFGSTMVGGVVIYDSQTFATSLNPPWWLKAKIMCNATPVGGGADSAAVIGLMDMSPDADFLSEALNLPTTLDWKTDKNLHLAVNLGAPAVVTVDGYLWQVRFESAPSSHP